MLRFFGWHFAALTVGLAACSPTLDWREVRVDDGRLVALFPCRPQHQERSIPLVGASLKMEMLACSADGSLFAVSFVDIPDPAAVTRALASLRETAAANLGAAAPRGLPFALPGMTANEQAARLVLAGRRSDGSAVHEHALFFVKGLRVYQATVIGAAPAVEAVGFFSGGLKFAL